MSTARELLLSTLEEKRPLVLLLGQDAWCDSEHEDTVLAAALANLGRAGDSRPGWVGILPMTEDRYQWLAERFERRVHPPSVEILSELPWSAAFTSSVDPTLTKVFSGPGRQPEPILTADEDLRAARSTARPPLYYLFSRAGEQDAQAQPPVDTLALRARRTRHAVPLLARVLDTATPLGTIVIDGFKSGRDWIGFEALLSVLSSARSNQVLWFGGRPDIDDDDQAHFAALESENRILVEPTRLGTVIAELRATGRLADITPLESGDVGIVSLGDRGAFDVTPEERLRVEAVASIVDDSWTSFLPPLGPDSEYDSFRRFHGVLGGARLLVEGVRREFAIERDFEEQLFRRVSDALADHSQIDLPIVVEGQSGTGKSVALARIVARVREQKTAPVLYSIGRIPQSEEISDFCQTADRAHARATLIVCDANRDVDSYDELLSGLRSRGRRVVVLGSQYRVSDAVSMERSGQVEAPAMLSQSEQSNLEELLGNYLNVIQLDDQDQHFLGFLYRHLPASRPRIGSGLGAEARAAAQLLDERGRQPRAVRPINQIHQQLIDKGFISSYQPIFNDRQPDPLEEGGGRMIDMVMVAGRLNCPVPVNLLLRAVSGKQQLIDSALVSGLFGDLDLFRWKPRDSKGTEWLVSPRVLLEAELICQRRLGSSQTEARVIVDLIGSVRQGIEDAHEREFLLNILRQIGRDGPYDNRYKHSYVDFARKLTELRKRFNVVDARLMLQESAFRRSAVREREVDDDQRFALLEEARDTVQTALDEIDNGRLYAARRTKQNLLVERAAIYGFLAIDHAKRMVASGDVWSTYQAAKVAVHKAVSSADNYYPHDVGLWTPADLLGLAELTDLQLTDLQLAELEADIYSGLNQVEKDSLPPGQREKFELRRMQVGNTLGDRTLTEEAYDTLEAAGSTAGYFLRARKYAPELNKDDVEVTTCGDLEKARRAAKFLTVHLDNIRQDERCLWLLLENLWIAEMRRRPLRGERQPLPVGDVRRKFLDIVRSLNHAAGESSRYGTRYLEAVLTWLEEDYVSSREIFRQLHRETDNVYRGRIFLRHVVSDANGTPVSFTGRVERQHSEGRWQIRVRELNQTIALLERDFPREDVRYGRELSRFAIAFNFIGPIADPIRR